jgi:hypothetical protein
MEAIASDIGQGWCVVNSNNYSVPHTEFLKTFPKLCDDASIHYGLPHPSRIFGSVFFFRFLHLFSSCLTLNPIDVLDSETGIDVVSSKKTWPLVILSIMSFWSVKPSAHSAELCIYFLILQHCFGLDNINLIRKASVMNSDNNGEESNSTPTGAKHPCTQVGRIPKGEDFWGKVDKFFTEMVSCLGTNLVGPAWRG